MTVDDIERLAAIMVRYRLAEISTEGLRLKKTMHEVERFQTDRAPREDDEPRNPAMDPPTDDEILFHSSYAPRMTVEDLIAKQEKANGHG